MNQLLKSLLQAMCISVLETSARNPMGGLYAEVILDFLEV